MPVSMQPIPGPFNKTITVKVAGIDAPVQLRITGEVVPAAAPAAPAPKS